MALRICNEDGTHHFGEIKALANSGAHYLARVNSENEPTAAMLIGSVAHFETLGPRPTGKRLVRFPGERRAGADWKDFLAKNADAEILTAPEWERGREVATAIAEDPLAQAHIAGARFETPLAWEEEGLKFSTTGVDLITSDGGLGDMKLVGASRITSVAAWERHAFSMLYHCQVAFYLRGARACGLKVSGKLFVLGIGDRSPFVVVPLYLTADMISLADRTISGWLERLKVYRANCPEPQKPKDWPALTQCPVEWDVPKWAKHEDEGDDDDLEDAA